MNYPNGPYPDEMFEEAERREAENRAPEAYNKAWEAVERFFDENDDGLRKLAEIEMEEYTDEQIKQWSEDD